MSETAQGGIIVICGLIVFIYGILRWVIWGKSRAQRFIEKAQKNGCKAEAVCVKTKDLHKSTNRDIYRIVKKKYEYMVNGQKYYITLKFESGVMKNPPYYITVYYDKRRPKKAVYAMKEAARNRFKPAVDTPHWQHFARCFWLPDC